MKQFLMAACFLTGGLLAAGCASKKYVRTTIDPVRAKVDQVEEQTPRNTQAINHVDERAENGISDAREQTVSADQHSATADQHANEAMSRANQAADEATHGLADLPQVISKIDGYELRTSASILFKFNQFRLNSDAKRQLDQLAAKAKSDSRFLITVEGFTDRMSFRQFDQPESRRVESAVHYLVTRHEIPIYRIRVLGLSEGAQNRRVEVKLFSADGVKASLNGHSETSANRPETTDTVTWKQRLWNQRLMRAW